MSAQSSYGFYFIGKSFLLLLLASKSDVLSHKCYVCGPVEQGYRKDCKNFDLKPDEYIENCSQGQMGCSTQYQDVVIARQCEEVHAHDCKIANHIRYCFCQPNLCNGIKSSVDLVDDDDDDSIESSGIEEMEDNILKMFESTTTMKTHETKVSGANKLTPLIIAIITGLFSCRYLKY